MSVGRSELTAPVSGEHRIFGYIVLLLTLLVFTGFARTFYLHNFFAMPAPSLFLRVHGTLMSGWILLLCVQTALVSLRRVKWHRRLGIVGAVVAALSIPFGCLATVKAAQCEVHAHSAFVAGQLNVLGLELTQMLLFAVFVSMALRHRGQPATHKRLMIVATLCIVPNAIVRLSLLTNIGLLQSNLHILFVWSLLVVGVVAADSLRQHRLHSAFGWSASAAIVGLYLAWYASHTVVWDRYWIQAFS